MTFRPTQSKRMTGAAGETLPLYEQVACIVVAEAYGIEPEALAAVRIAESGGPGNEFGVLSIPEVDTYGEEARVAAESIRNNIGRFTQKYGHSPYVSGRLSLAFWNFMQERYAPRGAGNDPDDLNRHWAKNVSTYYKASGVALVGPPAIPDPTVTGGSA